MLQSALASGAITGAELRARNGHLTTVGEVSGSAGSAPLPRGATLRLSTKPPLAGLAHLEIVIAGLLLAVAAAAAMAIALARLLPHLRRPQLPARRPGKPPRLPSTPALDTEYLARHDALTGLPNRVLLREEAQRLIMRLNGDAMALILMDLNEFKEVNDTLGHFAGDQLLRQVGERLARFATESTLVARLGGDEFAILRSQADAVTAEQLAMRVGESLRRPFLVSGMTLEIDASMGIALAPVHASDYDGLLQRADSAMYASKRNHTGIAMHTSEQEADNSQKLALASDLRRAIEGGQLSLYYQPKATLQQRGHLRCRGAGSVEAPRPRHDQPRPVHPAGRAQRVDQPALDVGAEDGAAPGRRLEAHGSRDAGVDQPLGPRSDRRAAAR